MDWYGFLIFSGGDFDYFKNLILGVFNNNSHENLLIIDKTIKIIIVLFFVYNLNKEFFDEK